jgi:hypothetical protein
MDFMGKNKGLSLSVCLISYASRAYALPFGIFAKRCLFLSNNFSVAMNQSSSLALKCLSLLLLLTLGCAPSVRAWGFWAHQRINRLAVFTLPPELLGIYKENIDYLTEHAVDPDKRRYAIDGEAAHHYIDIDHYGEYPFHNVPRYWEEAVAKLTADTLEAYGVVPYHIPVVVYRLAKAFEARDLSRIMKLSADLGHYIGDAHVPLHTTLNYNGQLTGQKGIHGFWESRLPELFAEEYDFFVGQAYLVSDLHLEAWDAVLESHRLVDDVLGLEQQLSETFPASKKYGYESRNRITVRTYSRAYAAAYHDLLDNMVETRMRRAILRIGAFWYTAWHLAGRPDLSSLREEAPLEVVPNRYEKKLKIEDREEFDLGYQFYRPGQRAKPMGMYRYMAANQQPSRERVRTYRDERQVASAYLRRRQAPSWWAKLVTWWDHSDQ